MIEGQEEFEETFLKLSKERQLKAYQNIINYLNRYLPVKYYGKTKLYKTYVDKLIVMKYHIGY